MPFGDHCLIALGRRGAVRLGRIVRRERHNEHDVCQLPASGGHREDLGSSDRRQVLPRAHAETLDKNCRALSGLGVPTIRFDQTEFEYQDANDTACPTQRHQPAVQLGDVHVLAGIAAFILGIRTPVSNAWLPASAS